MLRTSISPGSDGANAVALDTRGRIVAAGYSYNATDSDFALLRYIGERTRSGACANTQRGSAGRDVLLGTRFGDRLLGRSGHDTLLARRGNDCLNGGAGADRGFGERGNDRLIGGGGRDRLVAGAGRDRLWGNGAADRLFGGPGRDNLSGGLGRDVLLGGPGPDRILARDGRQDRIRCGTGRDLVKADSRDNVERGCERVVR